VERACLESLPLRLGLNLYKGRITYEAVALAFKKMKLYTPVEKAIG
jgi:alanine dehydrogenase